MEVKSIGQGGQTAFDSVISSSNVDRSDTQNTADNSTTSMVQDKDNDSAKKITGKDIKNAVDKLNRFMEGDGTKVEYEMHDKFRNDIIIKIVDTKTGQIISEVPPKKILDMVAKMCEMVGVLFDKKA